MAGPFDSYLPQQNQSYVSPQTYGRAAPSPQTNGGGGTMLPVVGAAISGVASGLTSLFGGGGGGPSKPMSLPPELELQMLNYFNQALTNNGNLMQQNQQLYDTYSQRANLALGAMQGSVPSQQAMQQMQQSTMQLATMFGGDAKSLIEQGFLSPADKGFLDAGAKELSDMKALEGQNFQDPRVENQLKEQRRSLEQDLARQGVGPAQRAIALSQFEAQAKDLRFTTSQTLATQATARGMQRLSGYGALGGQTIAARQANYGMAQQGYGTMAGQLQMGQQSAQAYNNLAGNMYGQGQQALGVNRQLMADQQGYFSQLGQFGISKTGQQLLASGVYGPGSIYQQTGVPRNMTKSTYGFVNAAEKAQFAQNNQLYQPFGEGRPGYTGNPNFVSGVQGNQTPSPQYNQPWGFPGGTTNPFIAR